MYNLYNLDIFKPVTKTKKCDNISNTLYLIKLKFTVYEEFCFNRM